jgi:YVTN family beta-propeller protein
MKRFTFGVCAALLAISVLHAQSSSPALLVLAKTDQTMAIVDPVTMKVTKQVPAGPDPHELTVSSDNRTAYIANYGFGAHNTITPIDLTTGTAMPAIDLGPLRGPHGMAFAGGKVWFTAEAAKAVASYDPASKKVDWVLGVGQNRSHMLIVSPDLNRLVTTNVNSATLTFIERVAAAGRGSNALATNTTALRPGADAEWQATVVPVGRGVEGFDISPDGKEIWAGNALDGTFSIVDVATRTVTQTIQANLPGINRVKFTPDGTKVFASVPNGTDEVVYDAVSRRELKRIPIGRGGAGILMQPDGARAYVACSTDNYVAVIDLRTLTVVGKIETGRGPDGVAWKN